jgi:hypothetical protein
MSLSPAASAFASTQRPTRRRPAIDVTLASTLGTSGHPTCALRRFHQLEWRSSGRPDRSRWEALLVRRVDVETVASSNDKPLAQ